MFASSYVAARRILAPTPQGVVGRDAWLESCGGFPGIIAWRVCAGEANRRSGFSKRSGGRRGPSHVAAAAEEEKLSPKRDIGLPCTRIIEGLSIPNQNLTGAVDRIDEAHSEEDAGALVELSFHVITATRLTSKAFERSRKEARKVAGFRDPLEEVGTLGASLKKSTARVAGVQRIEGARKRGVCKRQVPIVTDSALRSGRPRQDDSGSTEVAWRRERSDGVQHRSQRNIAAVQQYFRAIASVDSRETEVSEDVEPSSDRSSRRRASLRMLGKMDDTDNSSDAGVGVNESGCTDELKLKIEALKLELEIEKLKFSRASQDAAPSRSETSGIGRYAKELRAVLAPMPANDTMIPATLTHR
ncbi:hypothetical protein HPB52_001105 [Rhipicephalus sanguineus]|uniref:Uncharacterized protein n=1 Tax=Rhipicephalus sanguineus TaxID=34632 RepID=A0A9D4QJC5_RHISA|nr:hypothetical protein HPB52_001105 [Rhipicephalus sanguineus]